MSWEQINVDGNGEFKMKTKLGFAAAALLLTGCANWALQERCEKTNWFEYSRDLAMTGRYLEEDGFVKECKGVDRTSATQLDLGFKNGRDRYCTYENFLRQGEAGEIVNFKMCDNLILKHMQERYAGGLKGFCTADHGYKYGSAGKTYKNVCLRDAEAKFLPTYFKGRKEFLEKSILRLGVDIAGLQAAQASLSARIDGLQHEIQALPSPQECRNVTVYVPSTEKYESRTVCEESFYIRSRRQQLYDQIDPLRAQHAVHAGILSKMLTDLQFAREELVKIPTAAANW